MAYEATQSDTLWEEKNTCALLKETENKCASLKKLFTLIHSEHNHPMLRSHKNLHQLLSHTSHCEHHKDDQNYFVGFEAATFTVCISCDPFLHSAEEIQHDYQLTPDEKAQLLPMTCYGKFKYYDIREVHNFILKTRGSEGLKNVDKNVGAWITIHKDNILYHYARSETSLLQVITRSRKSPQSEQFKEKEEALQHACSTFGIDIYQLLPQLAQDPATIAYLSGANCFSPSNVICKVLREMQERFLTKRAVAGIDYRGKVELLCRIKCGIPKYANNSYQELISKIRNHLDYAVHWPLEATKEGAREINEKICNATCKWLDWIISDKMLRRSLIYHFSRQFVCTKYESTTEVKSMLIYI